MRRLYLQIYLTFLIVLLLFGALMALAWWVLPSEAQEQSQIDGLAMLLSRALPPAASAAELEAELGRLDAAFQADLALLADNGTVLASTGGTLPSPPSDASHSTWMHGRGRGPVLAFRLEDGRWLIARPRHHRRPILLAGALVLLLAAIGAGSYPLVRRLTRRVERLQRHAEALGAGDLKARVAVEGGDEVADLARSFNRAADRIERLFAAQKALLANVSHELRTPLTRVRMALELLPSDVRPELKAAAARDVDELDGLIGELLLASRLDAQTAPAVREEVDLLALAAEEAAGPGLEVAGTPVTVRGDARLLRRLVRNLVTNARRYGGAAGVRIDVAPMGDASARLAVTDRGPGVPLEDRERIFEPFYRGANATAESAGLGLALVRQIARHHGGEVSYAPAEGGGARFEVILPRGAAVAE